MKRLIMPLVVVIIFCLVSQPLCAMDNPDVGVVQQARPIVERHIRSVKHKRSMQRNRKCNSANILQPTPAPLAMENNKSESMRCSKQIHYCCCLACCGPCWMEYPDNTWYVQSGVCSKRSQKCYGLACCCCCCIKYEEDSYLGRFMKWATFGKCSVRTPYNCCQGCGDCESNCCDCQHL